MNAVLAEKLDQELRGKSAGEVIRGVLELGLGRAVVTTNFRPYEAVILHLAAAIQPRVDVLWVDHGANLPETYRFADATMKQVAMTVYPYLPKMTAEHWKAINGGLLPTPDEVEKVEDFSRVMKLEPFERGMREMAPAVWITALRREQNPQRAATLKTVMWDEKFQTLKVNPLLDWTRVELDAYVAANGLPNENTYYDPAKGDEKHECGLHAALTTDAAK
ncbi:MAG: phosphoadenosine phosphosulfate reductase family protein [Verrucomicrobiaceae bacterium]|nr:phosphoadenosine phosphosulfate reductase family protein [Verrucomicrobiaceae bacterium]